MTITEQQDTIGQLKFQTALLLSEVKRLTGTVKLPTRVNET